MVVIGLRDQHLRLVHEPAEGRRMHDPVAIPLIETAISVRRLGMTSAPAVFRSHGIRSEQINFALHQSRAVKSATSFFRAIDKSILQEPKPKTKNQGTENQEPRTQEPNSKFTTLCCWNLVLGSWTLLF